ncbi:MAG: hypothetical protein AB7O21_19910 [Gammaproteobacteria bacterium]
MRHPVALLLALWAGTAAGGEETRVAQVIATCERALAAGYAGLDAAACDWFVRPCGVCGVDASPAWCVPAEISAEALAATLVAELRRVADPAVSARPRIEAILRARYPCPAGDATAPAGRPRTGSRPTPRR